jgi:hypothetical protein
VTVRRALAGLQRLLAGVVLAVSGTYLLVYLYRWEWNRAIVSGLFFVAAEVALATAMILRRLRALEARDAVASSQPAVSPRAASQPAVLQRLRSTPVSRPHPFRWLSPRDGVGRAGVFVPVLLGAGVVLSALAFVVERVAEATALPLADRRLATRLHALSLPGDGLAGRRSVPATVPRRRPMAFTLGALVALASMVVLGWLGLGALVDATQSRPDAADRPASTTIELEVIERRDLGGPEVTAAALWVGCRWTVSRTTEVDGQVVVRAGNRVDLVLRPGIGDLAARRLTGCLSDLTIDLVRADVLAVRSTQ